MNRPPELPPLDPELAALVAESRADGGGPDPGQRARLDARLAATLAAPVAATVASSSSAAAAGLLGKPAATLLVLALGAGAVTGIYKLASPDRTGAGRAVPPAPAQPVAAPAQPVEPKPTPSAELARWAEERRLIGEARSALASGRPGEARAKLEHHQQAFPAGLLAEEREALHVQVLVAEQRRAEAVEAAARFQARYPRSLHGEAVRRALAVPGRGR